MSQSFLKPNWEPIAGYRLRRYLGRGGFGEVWEAEAPGGLAKAVKIAPVETSVDGVSCRELEGLQKIRSVRHPYLLSIERFEVIGGYLVIVMELADRSLADRFNECAQAGLPGIPRDELLAYLREAAEVLDLLNERHGLQHLDIKPENLFLSCDHVKVADFGLVQPRNTSINRSAIAISPPYAPPELFDGRIEPTADQYSLAVAYQELLTGVRPYTGSDVRGLILQHLKGRPELSPLPPSDRAIVGRALQRDPSARYQSCTELVRALENAPSVAALADESPALTPSASRRRAQTDSLPPPVPARPLYIRARLHKETERAASNTAALREELDVAARLAEGRDVGGVLCTGENVSATFLAFLPVEIFAHKLRGFIDALEAEIIRCSTDRTVLYFGAFGWFGRPSPRGVFLSIDTVVKNPHSGYRVVDVAVWSAGRKLSTTDLGRRGMLLIQCLKHYLMAAENHESAYHSDAEVRAAILA